MIESLKQNRPIVVLLVDDQPFIANAVEIMLKQEPEIQFHYCQDPAQAITKANAVSPTVILQDLVMPDIEGLVLLRYFRANPATKQVPMIVLSSTEDPKVKAQAFELGANDYMVKLPDQVELLARIHYHSAAYIRLLERNEAYEILEESQRSLRADLAEAAQYVESLLPHPLTGDIVSQWRFIPSTHLGGDAFGHHWIDNDHLAIYLLDVCGHGVGAALLSVTIMNVLLSETLPNTDFHSPVNVLHSLNETFPMEKHHNMFFTIWYGVYNQQKKELTYATGGHPPAILVTTDETGQKQIKQLKTEGLVIGAMENALFQQATCPIQVGDILYIFSDGVYEIGNRNGNLMSLQEFIQWVHLHHTKEEQDLNRIIEFCQTLNERRPFDDDFSILKIIFNASARANDAEQSKINEILKEV